MLSHFILLIGIQLKYLGLLRLGPATTKHTALYRRSRTDFFKMKFIIDIIRNRKMITLYYKYYKLLYEAGYLKMVLIKPILIQFD